MIIVIELLRNVFIFKFVVFMVLELIVLLCFTLFYTIPLKTNMINVEISSMNNTKEVLNSFNILLTRKYYNIETDLLIVAKHLYPMYLAQDQTVERVHPKYSNTGNFYKTLKNCLIESKYFNNSVIFLNFQFDNKKETKMGLFSRLMNKNKNFTKIPENIIIDKLFSEESFDQITFFANNLPKNFDKFETYSCYAMSVFKSIFFRNILYEKNNLVYDRFLLFLDNDKILQYPPDFFELQNIKNLNYYRLDSTLCTGSFKEKECFTTFQTGFTKEKYQMDKDIYFDPPILDDNNQLMSRGCIQVLYSSIDNNNYACVDFNINNIIKKVDDIDIDIVSLFLINFNSKIDDFDLFYSSSYNLIDFDNNLFTSNALSNNYKLTSKSNDYNLFHGLYYDIFSKKAYSSETDIINLINEYATNKKEIKKLMDELSQQESKCDNYNSVQSNITMQQSFSESKTLKILSNI